MFSIWVSMADLKHNNVIPVVVLNDTRVDHHHGCIRVMMAVESLLGSIGCCVIASAPAHADWTKMPAVTDAITKAKLLVVNGEGTIHHKSAAGMKLLEAADWAAVQGIPSILLNCAWQDNGADFVEKLRRFTLVATRDSRSAAEIKAAGISCHTVPDLSLYLPGVAPVARRQRVGFTDNVVRPVSLQLEQMRQRCAGESLPIQFVEPGMAAAVHYFREYVGKQDLLQPAFLAGLFRLRWLHYHNQTRSIDAFLRRLAELELLVSGRFHACTLAMVTETPFIAVRSNSHKIEALIEDAGLSSWRLSDALTPEIVEHARRTGWEPEEQRKMRDYLAFAREGAHSLFKEIGKLP
jgi:hypothetical protein